MRLRSFRLRNFLVYLSAALVYPVIVLVTAENRLLKFIDSLTVVGLVMIILGVVFSLIGHGDFDIISYVAQRSAARGHFKSFAAFREDQEEKRKDSANYPLLTGILFLVAAALLTLFAY